MRRSGDGLCHTRWRAHRRCRLRRPRLRDFDRGRPLINEVPKGKKMAGAAEVFAHFHARVTGADEPPLTASLSADAERLEPLTGVKAYPSRVKCATLSWHALQSALKGETRTVKTE